MSSVLEGVIVASNTYRGKVRLLNTGIELMVDVFRCRTVVLEKDGPGFGTKRAGRLGYIPDVGTHVMVDPNFSREIVHKLALKSEWDRVQEVAKTEATN